MQFTVKQIAEYINGDIEGDGDKIINQFNKIEEGKPNGISFLANPKYESYLYKTDSSAVVVNKSFKPKTSHRTTLIKVDDAYSAFSTLLKLYESIDNQKVSEVAKSAVVSQTSRIGKNVSIGANSFIGEEVEIADDVQIGSNVSIEFNVKIGTGTQIHANVSIYAHTEIGNNCIVKGGAVIGSGGFGFVPNAFGTYDSVPQIGNVIIGDHVSVGANTCIDRGTMGSTVIGEGVKIDNMVQIAHNVTIGNHTVIAAQTGISGSAKIGKHCIIGGQVGFVGHIVVADYTTIGAKAGVISSVPSERTTIGGNPAFNVKDYLRSSVFFQKLPQFEKRITTLEKDKKTFNER
jgi:UDP-3-O-[3-hydroxymyristoyl] glucosamine N-acyltransferase